MLTENFKGEIFTFYMPECFQVLGSSAAYVKEIV